MGHPVPMKGDEIALALEAKSRQPFREILARILDDEPTPEAMREFAKKSPNRRAQAIAILGTSVASATSWRSKAMWCST